MMFRCLASAALVALFAGCAKDAPAEEPQPTETKAAAGCSCPDTCECAACTSGDHAACACKH